MFLSWDVNILGTDISNAAVRQASQGRYTKHEIQRGMKPGLLPRYFTEEAGSWKVKDQLRAPVSFARCNPLQPFAELGPFDVILCRNVAIYFEASARRSLSPPSGRAADGRWMPVRRLVGMPFGPGTAIYAAPSLPGNLLPA